MVANSQRDLLLTGTIVVVAMMLACHTSHQAECDVSEDCLELGTTPCVSDQECAGGQICHLYREEQGLCATIKNGSKKTCSIDGQCVECVANADCLCHQACTDAGSCAYVPGHGAPAPGAVPEAAACAESGDCASPLTCNTATGLCECISNTDCAAGDICASDSHQCVAGSSCVEDGDCTAGYACLATTGRCIDVATLQTCSASRRCPLGLICDPSHRLCVEPVLCMEDRNCCGSPGYACTEVGLCLEALLECMPAQPETQCPYSPRSADDCPPGTFCVIPGVCVECTCDADCPTELLCAQATHKCIRPYRCDTTDECGESMVCDTANHVCVPRCANNNDCSFDYKCDLETWMCVPAGAAACEPDVFEGALGNNTRDTATQLAAHIAEIGNATACVPDEDWYRLPLEREAGQADSVTLRFVNVDPGVTLDLLVYAPDGVTRLVYTNNLVLNSATFIATATGDHFVRVVSSITSDVGHYSIQISYTKVGV